MSIVFFTLMMTIKGGWHWRIPQIKALDDGVMGFFLDGTRLSTLLVLGYVGSLTDPLIGLFFALAWFVGNLASMGEEAGAIGPPARGPYIEKGFGQAYGVKKGLQRGIYLGALLTFATFASDPSPWFIVAGATFPLCYFAGQYLYLKIHKTSSWAYAEPIYGLVIGLAVNQWLGG